MDEAELAGLLEQGWSLERIGRWFGRHPSTVSYWMAKYGLGAVNQAKHAARGGIERAQLEALVETGMSIAEIAAEIGCSKATVQHWLKKHGLSTRWTAGRARNGEQLRAASEAGQTVIVRHCVRHGDAEFVVEGRGYYRCGQCRSESVMRHRRRLKAALAAEAGGRCAICGYDRNLRALQFHHLDPQHKSHGIAAGATRSLDALRAEVRKCVLLCANCHAEVEDGATTLPIELRSE